MSDDTDEQIEELRQHAARAPDDFGYLAGAFEAQDPWHGLELEDLRVILNESLRFLTEKQRETLKRVFGIPPYCEHTFKELAAMWGLCEQAVRNRFDGAIRQVRTHRQYYIRSRLFGPEAAEKVAAATSESKPVSEPVSVPEDTGVELKPAQKCPDPMTPRAVPFAFARPKPVPKAETGGKLIEVKLPPPTGNYPTYEDLVVAVDIYNRFCGMDRNEIARKTGITSLQAYKIMRRPGTFLEHPVTAWVAEQVKEEN